MKKRLSKHGNSLAVIIDKPILSLLNITESSEIEITTDGVSVIITPSDKKTPSADKKFESAMNDFFKKYDSLMKKLADK
jgi:putative addiction module antidote